MVFCVDNLKIPRFRGLLDMVKIEYSFDVNDKQIIAAEQKKAAVKEAKECVSPLDTSYIDGSAKCAVTVDDKNARIVVSGDEGIFKDMQFPLNKATRLLESGEYLFICSLDKNLIFPARKESFSEGNYQDLTDLIAGARNLETSQEIKEREKEEKLRFEKSQRRDAEQYFGKRDASGKQHQSINDLKDRFKIQKYFAIGFAILGMLESLDGGLFGGGGVTPLAMVTSGLIGLIMGFIFSYVYIFFRAWFDQQQEKVKVGSIVLFIVTVPTFLILGILGAIPYSVYALIDGKKNTSFIKIVKFLTPIVAGVVILAELAFVSLFLI